MKVFKMNEKEYKQAIKEGRTIHAYGYEGNRADSITIDNVNFFAPLFFEKHGYNWRQTAGGVVWYYAATNGDELQVDFRKHTNARNLNKARW